MAQIPTFPVIGNHEKDSHWYYDYFSLPKPEYYYTFRYGNAQFFMIDSNKPLGPSSPQYEWLEKELAASKATWKFTCHHHPCFSSDENDYGDHDKGSPSGTSSVLATPTPGSSCRCTRSTASTSPSTGTSTCTSGPGRSSRWRSTSRRESAIITSGGGGGSLEQAAPQRTWFSLHFQQAYHYCYAAISDRTIVFKAYDIDGLMFDTFELTKATDR